jgi:flagellar motor switch/type III secretory pathway protein FliN
MTLRPYKLFGAAERQRLADAFQAQLGVWGERWLPPGAQPRCACAPACEWAERLTAAGGQWTAIHGPRQEAVHVDLAALDLGAFARAMLGAAEEGAPSTVAEQLAREALLELGAALVGGTQRTNDPPPAHAWARGSACVAAALEYAGGRATFVCSPEWTARQLRELAAPRPNAVKPKDRSAAIAAQRVGLRVVAGWAELDVGELRALRPGDVIALERPISEPLSVVVAAGRERAVCSARLGFINGRKAACLSATGSHGTR